MPVILLRLLTIFAAVVVSLWLGVMPASAQSISCTYTVTPMVYGVVDLAGGAQVDSTATLSATCTGKARDTAYICPNIGGGTGGAPGGNRQLLNGANVLLHQFYSDPGRSVIWGSGVWPYAPQPPVLTVPLGSTGTATGSWTIYGRLFGGQPAGASGVYSSTFSGTHVSFRVTKNANNACNTGGGTASAVQPAFIATATVLNSCALTTTDLNFGTTGLLTGNIDAAGAVRVTCSLAAPFRIDLTVPSGETATTRTMSKGAEVVTYGLYKDTGRTQPWGDTGAQGVTGTGTGLQQTIPVYGRVPAQDTPSAGAYADTVIVTVTH